ncbi:MAG TPA: Gfo/Idh/MocA family oxidoreductase, partial [Sumerlaeia bacterium]|nr:Gfo/Idh/MocA family oxidoreductase [Sumerlaeia bacterium]
PWLPARWGCVLARLKELVGENAIGNVFLVRHAVCSFATRSDWQTERRYGGGYLLNWGPHIVDPPIVLMGARVESVYGRMKQTVNPGDAEDVFLALMNLVNGAVAQVEYTVAAEDLPHWFIQGDRGTIVVRGREITIHKKTPLRPADPTDFATMKPAEGDEPAESETLRETVEGAVYGDENAIYAEVAQAIRGEKEFPVRPEHALELTRVLDAIRLAGQENRVVVL